MSSDFSRQRFQPAKNFSSVLMQQGRVQLDADWNEGKDIIDRRWRSETIDLIGRGVVPRETPNGFQIAVTGGELTIGRGRIYIDGLQAENHGAGALEFDPVLAEQRGSGAVRYDEQPYLPNAPALPDGVGPHLVYVVVWQREVTAIEDPALVENAVAVDTTSRLQTVWQVRLLPDIGDATCATPDDEVPGWLDVIRPPDGRLTTKAVGVATTDDPCLVPPSGGYRGLENRFYRIEIHDTGPAGQATFKWSRDNASLATNVSRIEAERTLTIDRAVWDSIRRFSPGDWVEITDDWREFSGAPGEIRRIASVVDASRTLTLEQPLTVGLFPVDGQHLTDPTRHTRIKRWDQSGLVRDANGGTYHDLDAPGSTGVIPVPPPGTSLILEDGVQVTFTTVEIGGTFRACDYWNFAARTADASVETLDAAPPRGIHRHYCRLAIVTFPGTVQDCRTFWPPAFGEGESCDCTICVSAEQHNSGALTIQQAVDQIRLTGGTICLGPGTFNLSQGAVNMTGAFAVRLRGQGAATTIIQPRADAAFLLSLCQWCTLDYLSIHTVGSASSFPAIRLNRSLGTTFERLIISPPEEGEGPLAGVWIEPGFLMLTTIRDNVIRAQHGVAFAFAGATGEGADDTPLLLAYFRVEKNFLTCAQAAIRLHGAVYNHGDVVLARNVTTLTSFAAIVFKSSGQAEVDVVDNTIAFDKGDGIVCGGCPARISGNEIGSPQQSGGRGIRLVAGDLNVARPLFLVSENRVSGLQGPAISVETFAESMKIERNLLRDLRGNGIVMTEGGAEQASILGNELTHVATAAAVNAQGIAVAGIHLVRVGQGLVADNVLNDVGRDAALATIIAGIRLDACRDVRVSDNSITNLAPVANFANLAAGVLVSAPFVTIDVVSNLIRRQVTFVDVDGSNWQAVRINGLASTDGIKQPFAGFNTLATMTRIRAINHFAAAAAVGSEEAGVTGNALHGFGGTAVAEVFVTGTCRLADNHCTVGPRRVPFAVGATARSILAASNRVECERETHALELKVVGQQTFTVLGNITGGPIFVNGSTLAAPWQPLNVSP